MQVKFWLDPKYPNAKLPVRASKLASGMDVFAAEDCVLPGFRLEFTLWSLLCPWRILKLPKPTLVQTGLRIADMDPDCEIQVRSRSGNTLNKSFFVMNGPGTLDADFLGNVGVILLYTGAGSFYIKTGDKIAQFVVQKVERPTIVQVSEITRSTERAEGGFGSTG